MKILLTGASGFIGTTLTRYLRGCGHQVVALQRGNGAPTPCWEPAAGHIDLTGAEDVQAVVHLAGEPLLGRWTSRKKRRIQDSRVEGTRLLCEALAARNDRPGVLVSASAIGYYGPTGETMVDESSPPGDDFLAQVAVAWEGATQVAADHGIRVVPLRIGLVLSPEGGALAKMLTLFKMGMGGRLGTGSQWWSWIALDDLHAIILYVLNRPTISGPLNAVAPEAVTNEDFTRILAKVLKRPALIPVPAGLIKTVFGEMADATLLASSRVWPGALDTDGYEFRFSHLESALRHLLGR